MIIEHLYLSWRIVVMMLFAGILHACDNPSDKEQDIATKGEITILADESFKPIVEAEKFTFESLYPYATIHVKYHPESDIIKTFLEGKSESIITGRFLRPNEVSFLKSKGFSVQQTPIARDAILLLSNKTFPDSLLTSQQVESILSGKVTNWKDLAMSIDPDNISIVFDQANSSNFNYMHNNLSASKVNRSLFAAGSAEKVIGYVNSNSNAIGIIGWSWISDEEDLKAQSLLKDIKILGVRTEGRTYEPTIEDVNDSLYPYVRTMYAINKGARAGLGAGFASFMSSDRGQRIILKAGIVPYTVPGREIELK